ncbi:MAG: peptide ABC transporter permease [Candidatus Marinimicrobia bacterium]|nr:peptide ABC transporter permease [Candidatus Neomarinimicrobiota bacterium]
MPLGALLNLSIQSLINRRLTVVLTVFAIAVSVLLILGVEKVRHDAKLSFANTISGTDLIVGARSGSIQLLLYSVFRIGNATNNISWKSYQSIAKRKDVKWTIPISLGDSHRGFRVMGTSETYFLHYRYAQKRKLKFQAGRPFTDVFETVLGAEVAKSLGYKLGDEIVIDHGIGAAGFIKHEDKPFVASGILAPTGTPVDRTIHVSLEGITAIHVDWRGGAPIPGMAVGAEAVRNMDLTPKSITAFMVGLESRLSAFRVLRDVNAFSGEPLLAILPGVALQELWGVIGTAETALSAVAIMVVVGGLIGMVTMLLASLSERRREMAILRAVGARPLYVGIMFLAEAILIAGFGCLMGLLSFYLGMTILQPMIETHLGLFVPIVPPMPREWLILGLVMIASTVAGLAPALMAYRQSLADGMTVRY